MRTSAFAADRHHAAPTRQKASNNQDAGQRATPDQPVWRRRQRRLDLGLDRLRLLPALPGQCRVALLERPLLDIVLRLPVPDHMDDFGLRRRGRRVGDGVRRGGRRC